MHRDRERVRGFTLMELLIGMGTGVVLVLMAGIMLFTGYRAWAANGRAVVLQREGALAMTMLGRSLRATSSTLVSVSTNLVVAGAARYQRTIDGDLIYTPNITNSSDQMTVVDGIAAEFTGVKASTGVSLKLILDNGNNRAEFNGAWAFRN